MSIERQDHNVHFLCDECSDHIDTETADFTDAWVHAKQQGWRSFKHQNTWQHACPSCAQRFAQNPR